MPTRSQERLFERGTGSDGLMAPRMTGPVTDPASPDNVVFDASDWFNEGYTPPTARSDAFTYTASGLPTGTSINSSTGVVSGTATLGTYSSATITATNVYGFATTGTFTWTVGPQEPVVAGSITVTGTVPVVDLDFPITVPAGSVTVGRFSPNPTPP